MRKRTAEEPPSLLQNSGVSANAEVLFDYCRDGHDECVLEDEDLSQLTPSAVRAIVKSWDILPYSPSMTDVESWLDAVHKFCEEYEVPAVQRALCGIYKMEEGCREEASAGRCEEMMWDQFKTWLSKHDGIIPWILFLLSSVDMSTRREKNELMHVRKSTSQLSITLEHRKPIF